MELITQIKILDETVCISHSANTLRKGMNETILSPAIGKIVAFLLLLSQLLSSSE